MTTTFLSEKGGEKDIEVTETHHGADGMFTDDKYLSTSGTASTPDAHSDDDASSVSSVPQKLALSKARSIALVITVAGASFMNVSQISIASSSEVSPSTTPRDKREAPREIDITNILPSKILSIQAVVIILPTIGRDLGIPESRLQWVISAYSLTFGCFLLLWGRIADLYSKRLIFVAGSAWLALATVANAFVPNEIAFDLFRGLAGLGAAANVPTAIGILGTMFPAGKAKNYAFSAYAAGVPLGSVFGTILSGFIAQYTSWKWVFGVLALLAGIVAVAGFFVIPPPALISSPQRRKGSAGDRDSVDWIGGGLITIGLLALMLALTEGNVVGWKTPWISVLIAVSVVIIVAFWFWQRHLEFRTDRRPLMKTSIFHSRRFCAALAIMALFFSSFNNFLTFATYFYQNYQGQSVLTTTLYFLPTGVAGVLVAWASAHLISRVPTYLLLLFGNLSISIACLLFATPIPPTTSYFAYGLPAMILSVIGADTAWPSLTLFVSKSLPQEDQALGGALVNSVGQVGRSIGLAISTAIQTSVMASARGTSVEDAGPVMEWDQPSLDGLRAASWMNFALGVTSLVIVCVFFRSSEIVGKADDEPSKLAGARDEEAAANGDDASAERR
ncbi:major facilitator superfamily transporter [Colletotrichum plurivorum]|uniref:Major facilitator superfamily transporter n=1 Tax=Colletotrichum plurivorum TaxID=2175906 RepID=A0A8H6NF59_9PEZI|nr:major facilitator superfamily transporter [Colletotrichum plurivorum]